MWEPSIRLRRIESLERQIMEGLRRETILKQENLRLSQEKHTWRAAYERIYLWAQEMWAYHQGLAHIPLSQFGTGAPATRPLGDPSSEDTIPAPRPSAGPRVVHPLLEANAAAHLEVSPSPRVTGGPQ